MEVNSDHPHILPSSLFFYDFEFQQSKTSISGLTGLQEHQIIVKGSMRLKGDSLRKGKLPKNVHTIARTYLPWATLLTLLLLK